eukprot:g5342.t1
MSSSKASKVEEKKHDHLSKLSLKALKKKLKDAKKKLDNAVKAKEYASLETIGAEMTAIQEAIDEKGEGGGGGGGGGLTPSEPSNESIQSMSNIYDTLHSVDDILTASIDGWKMPAVVVVGGQSTGKSTLLERISSLPIFPRGKGMCTKIPIKIRLRFSKKKEDEKAKITIFIKGKDGKYRNAGGPPPFKISDGERVIADQMERVVKRQKDVALNTYISLEISGPSYPNLELFDMPGLVASKELGKKTHELSNTYLDELKGRCVVLLVRAVESEDAWNSQALQLIKKRGNDFEKWTIGVLTKCDKAVSNPSGMLEKLTQKDGDKETPRLTTNGYVLIASKPFKKKEESLEGFRQVEQKRRKHESKIFFGSADDEEEEEDELEDEDDGSSSALFKYLRAHKERATVNSLVRCIQALYKRFLCKRWLPDTVYRLNRKHEHIDRRRESLGEPEWPSQPRENPKRKTLGIPEWRFVPSKEKVAGIDKKELFQSHIVPALRQLVAKANVDSTNNVGLHTMDKLQSNARAAVKDCSRSTEIKLSEFSALASLDEDVPESLFARLVALVRTAVNTLDGKIVADVVECLRDDRDGKRPRTTVRLGRFKHFVDRLEEALKASSKARIAACIASISETIQARIVQHAPDLDFKKGIAAGLVWDEDIANTTSSAVLLVVRKAFKRELMKIVREKLSHADVDDEESCRKIREEYVKKQMDIQVATRKLRKLVTDTEKADATSLPILDTFEDVDLKRSTVVLSPKLLASRMSATVTVELRSKRTNGSPLPKMTDAPLKVSFRSKTAEIHAVEKRASSSSSASYVFDHTFAAMDTSVPEETQELHVTFCGQHVGPSPMELVVRNDVSSMRGAGIKAAELKRAGLELEKLRKGGYGAKECLDAEWSARDLKKANFKAKDFKTDSLTCDLCKKAGFSAKEAREGRYSAKECRQAGYFRTCRDCRNTGFSAKEARDAEYSAKECRQAGYFRTCRDCRNTGFSAKEARGAEYSAKECRQAGYFRTCHDCRNTGFSAKEARGAEYSAKEMNDVGYTAKEMNDGGYTLKEMQKGGYTAKDGEGYRKSGDGFGRPGGKGTLREGIHQTGEGR